MSELPPKVVTLGGDIFIPENDRPPEVQTIMDQVQAIINGNGGKAIAICVTLDDGSVTYAHHAAEGHLLSLLGAVEQLKFKVHKRYNEGWDNPT